MFEFVCQGRKVGMVSFKEGEYILEFDEDFFWLEDYLRSLLETPIVVKGNKLLPKSSEHLKATIEHLRILKQAKMDWERFVSALGGDIREVEFHERQDI